MTFNEVENECLIITLLLCKCTNRRDFCMNVCAYMYVCENDLWRCLYKNILSTGHYVSGGVTRIGSLTKWGHIRQGIGRWFPHLFDFIKFLKYYYIMLLPKFNCLNYSWLQWMMRLALTNDIHVG